MQKLRYVDALRGLAIFQIRLCILIPTTVAVATMFYWLVEQPTQRIGRKLIAVLEQ